MKRYSSGMYVRLAFAVAAHLEPEILIVDEVLAVGDAAFQKKCLGKMRRWQNAVERCSLSVRSAAISRPDQPRSRSTRRTAGDGCADRAGGPGLSRR